MKPKSVPGAAFAPSARRSRNANARGGGGTRVLVAGQVVGVISDGSALLQLHDGRQIPCRRPSTVDAGWLRAAVAAGPVNAEGTMDVEQGTGSIWCVFPGPEHDDVAAPTVTLVATERVSLQCGKASVALEKDGSLQVRGRDIVTRGSRSARISGGIVRIN
jgi:hypothetical protein